MEAFKYCKTCDTNRPQEDLYFQNQGKYKYRRSMCKECQHKKAMVDYKTNPRKRASIIVGSRKNYSKRKGIVFELDTNWLAEKIEKGVCEVTGIPIQMDTESYNNFAPPFSPSIDRIDPHGGYTKENSRMVCMAFNTTRNFYGDEVYYQIAKAFIEWYESKDMKKAA